MTSEVPPTYENEDITQETDDITHEIEDIRATEPSETDGNFLPRRRSSAEATRPPDRNGPDDSIVDGAGGGRLVATYLPASLRVRKRRLVLLGSVCFVFVVTVISAVVNWRKQVVRKLASLP